MWQGGVEGGGKGRGAGGQGLGEEGKRRGEAGQGPRAGQRMRRAGWSCADGNIQPAPD